MDETKVKGELYRKSLKYLQKKLGQEGMKKIKRTPDDYAKDKWYPFSDFCSLLTKIDYFLSDYYINNLYKMGYHLLASDNRYQTLFRSQDPREVFLSNNRQDALMQVGQFKILDSKDRSIKIQMSIASDDPDHVRMWTDYYQGCVKAVLDLTEKRGDIRVHEDPDDFYTRTFEVEWE